VSTDAHIKEFVINELVFQVINELGFQALVNGLVQRNRESSCHGVEQTVWIKKFVLLRE
jgi:hypothetical protein